MKSFLEEVVDSLYQKYGDGISDLTIVFPNRRASLFFARDLSHILERAVWQPRFCSIDDLLRDYTGLEPAHELTLLSLLYDVYRERVGGVENFDKFYSWGQMLLSDFDSIDKYMIDSSKLYANMDDLQQLESVLGDDFEEKELIINFWNAVNGRDGVAKSSNFTTFIGIWSKLDDVYREFKRRLLKRGVGYSGMIYLQAASMFEQQANQQAALVSEQADAPVDERTKVAGLAGAQKYVFVGFNALNRCEGLILDVLKREERAEFYWDADRYYLGDEKQEAGLFLRKNISRYGSVLEVPANFRKHKNIVEVINAPNDVMQCKALRVRLQELIQQQGGVDSETAIVLTDEKLLPVVLYSVPQEVKEINITMGAPLNQSAPYIFFERLMTLQMTRGEGGYYYDSVLAILSHEYVRSEFVDAVCEVENNITTGQMIYVDSSVMCDAGLAILFPPERLDARACLSYYISIVERFAFRDDSDPVAIDNNEYAMALVENLRGVGRVITDLSVEISASILHSLLGKINSATRIPFEGYPLKGLQIMGILESRCLDFKNVILLSLCDDTFPGNKASNTFIPPNLRKGFGLPTQVEHGAMWAYYFYRLISRAQNVTMMYSSSREGNATGEKSRYIYQMEYESGHPVSQVSVDLYVNAQKRSQKIIVQKSSEMLAVLRGMIYSPSSLNTYIDCPLKFYFGRLAKISPEMRPSGDIEANESGSVLHGSLEHLYSDFCGERFERGKLREIVESDAVLSIIDRAVDDVLKSRAVASEFQGRLTHLRRLIINQLKIIVDFDAKSDDLQAIMDVERNVKLEVDVDGETKVVIKGYVDRVDKMLSGAVRLVDYKSGKAERKFKGVDSLFTNGDLVDGQKYTPHNAAALQMLIYTLAVEDGVPGLFALKKMKDEDFSPALEDETTGEIFSDSVSELFRQQLLIQLRGLFAEIVNPEIPFTQTRHCELCKYCDYAGICNRSNQESD